MPIRIKNIPDSLRFPDAYVDIAYIDAAGRKPVDAAEQGGDEHWDDVFLLLPLDDIQRESRLVNAVAYNFAVESMKPQNVAEVMQPTWPAYFGELYGNGVFGYAWSPNVVTDTGLLPGQTLPLRADPVLRLAAYNKNWSPDLCDGVFEFLDAAGAVVAVIKTATDGGYSSGLWYGPSIDSLTKAARVGGYGYTDGWLRFTSDALTYTYDIAQTGYAGSNGYNQSFSFSCPAQSITQVRVSGVRAKQSYTGAGSAYIWLRYDTPFFDVRGHVTRQSGVLVRSDMPLLGGPCAYFSGQSHITIEDADDLDMPADFAVETFVRTESTVEQVLFSNISLQTHSWSSSINLIRLSTGYLRLRLYDAGAVMTVIDGATTPLQVGEVYHVEVDRLGDAVFVLINGVLEIQGTFADPLLAKGWTLGNNWPGGSSGFIGSMAGFRGTRHVRHTANFPPPDSHHPQQ